MADIAPKDVEILVHTTAPSHGQDDRVYRALAQAYLDFQPTRRQRIIEEPQNSHELDLDRQAGSQLRDELQHSTQDERESEASYRPDNEEGSVSQKVSSRRTSYRLSLSYMASPDLSFNSVDDNRDSPPIRARKTDNGIRSQASRQSQGPQLEDSWVAPPSVIPDSQPEHKNAMTAFSSPTRMLELMLQNQQSSGTRSTPDLRSPEQRDKSSSLELPAGARGSDLRSPEQHKSSSLDLPAGIRGRLSLSPEHHRTQSSPSPIKSRKGPTRRSARMLETRNSNVQLTQDPGLDLKRKWVASSSEESRSSSAPPKAAAAPPVSSQTLPARLEKRPCVEPAHPAHLQLTMPPVPVSSPLPVIVVSPGALARPSVWDTVLDIRPKPPATSTGGFTAASFITPDLQALVERIPIAKILRPLSQTRELREMERGHWRVDSDSWDEGLRRRLWRHLGNYIGQDHAGWCVWCVRDEDFKIIRVYCCGIIVGHIYSLLYVASECKIRGVGACWIAGNGEAIITMPS